MRPRSSFSALVILVAGCGGSIVRDDPTGSEGTPSPTPAPSSAPQSRAPWPMLGQGPSHQSRSPTATAGGAHRTWQIHLGEAIHGSCVIAEDGTVYAAGTSTLYAITPGGALKWSVPVAADQSSPALGSDGTVYVVEATQGAALNAFTPDGALKWQTHITGGPELRTLTSPTVASDGTIFVATMYGPLNAISPDGKVRWSRGDDRYSAPAIDASGALFTMQVSTYSSHLDAFSADGAQVYRVNGLGFTESYFNYPVLGQDGSVYVAAGGLFALGPGGARRWSQPAVVAMPPAIGADGTIYGSDGVNIAVAVRPGDGSRVWAYTEGTSDYGAAVALGADGTVYVGGNKVRVLSPTGALLQTYDVGVPIASALALDANGAVVFSANDGTVYAR